MTELHLVAFRHSNFIEQTVFSNSNIKTCPDFCFLFLFSLTSSPPLPLFLPLQAFLDTFVIKNTHQASSRTNETSCRRTEVPPRNWEKERGRESASTLSLLLSQKARRTSRFWSRTAWNMDVCLDRSKTGIAVWIPLGAWICLYDFPV